MEKETYAQSVLATLNKGEKVELLYGIDSLTFIRDGKNNSIEIKFLEDESILKLQQSGAPASYIIVGAVPFLPHQTVMQQMIICLENLPLGSSFSLIQFMDCRTIKVAEGKMSLEFYEGKEVLTFPISLIEVKDNQK